MLTMINAFWKNLVPFNPFSSALNQKLKRHIVITKKIWNLSRKYSNSTTEGVGKVYISPGFGGKNLDGIFMYRHFFNLT